MKRLSHPAAWLLFCLLCVLFTAVLLFHPIPRQIGLTARNDLFILPLIFILSFTAYALKQAWLRAIFRSLLFALILLPLSGLWNSGISEQYFVGGIIPWSDAFTLQLNTQRFLYGEFMGQSTALRPISSLFYAVFLSLTENNYLWLYLFSATLIALLIIFTSELIYSSFGTITAAFFFCNAYFYIRQRLGTFMTEPYGFITGMLACWFIFCGIRRKRSIFLFFGFLFLSISQNARPGPMFLLPAAGLWYFFCFLKKTPLKKRIILSVCALMCLVSGFLITSYSRYFVYGTSKIPNRQMGEIVYGLCQGGKSAYDVLNTPEIIALNESDNVMRDVVDLCLPILKENPQNIWLAFKTVFIDCLILDEERGSFSYFNGGPEWMILLIRYGFMLLWCAGIFQLIRARKNSTNQLLLAFAAALLLTQIIVAPFTTYRLRYHATSIWIPGIIIGLFPQAVFDRLRKYRQESISTSFTTFDYATAIVISGLILGSAIFSPVQLKNNPLQIPSSDHECAPGEDSLLTSIDPGSYIYLQNTDSHQNEHYPSFRLPFVRQHIHDTASVEMFEFTDAIEEPTAIIRNIDLETFEDALVFAPLDLVAGKTGKVHFCGKFIDPPILRHDRFFIPSSASFLEEEAE